MRFWPALLLVASCSSSGPGLKRPQFPEPRAGVWNSPVAVVDGTDDEMMPGVSEAGWLIYASNRGANVDIYRRPVAGGAPERLTSHSAEDTDPVFSPDGERIAYTSQSADVKGDIWVMDKDGSNKRQLTDRSTADSAPCWSPSGNAIYFTSAPLGQPERVERIDLEYDARTTVVDEGWDPAIASDGSVLFYVALDDRGVTRIYALRLSDGAAAAVTDGTYPEGFPRAAGADLLFVRFTDDRNEDRRLDGSDPASVWRVRFDTSVFDGKPPPPTTPLTTGSGSELFATAAGDWFVYTTAGAGDLEIYALPDEGIISGEATAESILEAARSEDESSLRRLALRYLVARVPKLEGPARYELARDLGERGNYREAISELQLAAVAFGDDPMATVSNIEIERLRMLETLNGRWWARDSRQRSYVEDTRERIGSTPLGVSTAVDARVLGTLAEARLALGERARASEQLEALSRREQAPAEDRARSLALLATTYERLGDKDTLIRLCERLLRDLGTERFYARQCAERWVASAPRPVGVPEKNVIDDRNALGVSVLAELESIATLYANIPMLAARARAELANAQSAAGYTEASRRAWQRIVDDYPNEREVLSRALLNLANGAEQRGALDIAIDSYEQLQSRFPENPTLRAQASRGIGRIALRRALDEERRGDLEAALADYRRLLRNNRELAVAHRRYILLSAKLGRLEDVLAEYEKAAAENPRDKLARYGYGYALTFEREPDIGAAENEVSAALEIDPRLAPAHLTLGWLRLQRERRSPRNGWAEKAVDSFTVATELIDPDTERRLYAAARLNAGNALLVLNKLDDAFLAYLDRERSSEPFDDALTELLFRERFARVALREDYLDIALDQGLAAYELAGTLEGAPRRASIAALIGGIYFLTRSYERALPWLNTARDQYRDRQDWDRAVPLTRTLALTARRAGRRTEAASYVHELETMLGAGHEPSALSRPLFIGFELQLWAEVAAKADDVTLGPYGFDASLERKLSRTLAAREAIAAGKIDSAKTLLVDRIELLRPLYETPGVGVRAIPEWLFALNDAAVVHAHAGEWNAAVAWWNEAIGVAAAANEWPAVIQMSESLLRAWLAAPELYSDPDAESATLGLETVLKNGDPDEAEAAARVLALVNLHRFKRSQAQLRAPRGASPETRFQSALANLDRAAASANRADRLARDYSMLNIEASLPPRPYTVVEPDREDIESQAEVAAPEPPSDSSPDEPEAADDLSLEADPPDAPAVAEDSGTARLVRASLDRRTRRWRRYFDAWEVTDDDSLLDLAIEGFVADPVPVEAPEHPRFLARAFAHLREDLERAWLLLEHERLLTLQPGSARIERGGAPREWLQLREQRGRKSYAPEKSRTLVRALEGIPVLLETLRKVLGPSSAFVQLHRVGARWLWFAADSERLNHFESEPEIGTIPTPLMEWLAIRPFETVYFDGGELRSSTELNGLPENLEILEVLSGTYLVASYDARNLSRAAPAVVSAERTDLGDSASIVHFELGGRLFGANRRAGESQVLLDGAANGDVGAFDLEAIGALQTSSQVALFDRVPQGARAGRLLAHAALLGGISSTVTTPKQFGAARTALNDALVSDRLSVAVRSTLPKPHRVFGFRGMAVSDRVVFAFDGLLSAARAALPVYKRAQKLNDPVLWEEAKGHYNELMGYIDYLLVPSHRELLATSPIKLGAAIAKTLPTRQLQFEQQLATTYFALDDTAQAAKVREHLIKGYLEAGQPERALKEYLDLGKVYFRGDAVDEARGAFTKCVELAGELEKPILEAECKARLGSVHRSTYDYATAVEYFESAIDLYARYDHPDLVDSTQFLGILYESSLNDYDAALEQFELALAAARRFEPKQKLVAKLLVSIARIFRLRGEYAPALESVQRAKQTLTADSDEQLTEILLETANIYWYRGNYRRARRAQTEALELTLKRADTFRRIQALGVGGLIALNQGELKEAETLIRSALELSRLVGRRSEEAAQLNNLGVVLQQDGRFDEAIQSYRDALAIDQELGSREGRAFDLRNLGTALGRKEQYDEALNALDEALALSQELGNRFNEIQSLFRRGEVLDGLGRGAEAGAMFDEAARLANQFAIPEVQWRSLYALGRLEEGRGQFSSARNYYLKALNVAERLGRSREAGARTASRDDLYEDAVRLAVRADDTVAVFELLDRKNARARLDALANRTVRFADSRAEVLLRAELRARDAVIAAERDLSRGREGAADALAAAREERERRYAALQAAFPRVARAFTITPASLDDALASLPESSGAVSYFIGQRRSWALLLAGGRAKVVELEAKSDTLAPVLETVRVSMRAFAPMENDLATLGGLLLTPLANDLRGLKHLVVVPDSGLAAVPFAALPFGDRQLVETLATSQVSSLSGLVDLMAVPPQETKTVSAFAYGSNLPFAKLEARSVDRRPYLDGDATLAALRSNRSDAWDLAVHAQLDPKDPLASTLEMAPSTDDDGLLRAADVFSFPRIPALVTLSGCETALETDDGSARLSLADAFITSGAQSVVATRHRVADFSAARLMKWFYRYFKDRSTAAALREAMLMIRRDQPHPAHWATFTLVGDFR